MQYLLYKVYNGSLLIRCQNHIMLEIMNSMDAVWMQFGAEHFGQIFFIEGRHSFLVSSLSCIYHIQTISSENKAIQRLYWMFYCLNYLVELLVTWLVSVNTGHARWNPQLCIQAIILHYTLLYQLALFIYYKLYNNRVNLYKSLE